MKRACPFCHEDVDAREYAEHLARHTRLQPDGQMEDHMTLPPGARTKGGLGGVPSVYRHAKCGECTEMPDEIIRTYLTDPKFYNGYTFCSHCGNYPHQSEFSWVDTGENLHAYNRRLFSEKGLGYKLLYALTTAIGTGLILAAAGVAVALAMNWPVEVIGILSGLAGIALGQRARRAVRLKLLTLWR